MKKTGTFVPKTYFFPLKTQCRLQALSYLQKSVQTLKAWFNCFGYFA